MSDKVVILGGGVGGMSAAHELIERGFRVEVHERQLIPGGKARSIPVMQGLDDHGSKDRHTAALRAFLQEDGLHKAVGEKRPWLPGEHGFRFFPNFYKHITNTLGRIPYGKGTCLDNLVDTTQILVALYDEAGIELPSRFPENAAELATALKTFLYAISPRNQIPFADIEHFSGAVWRIITSCKERRFEEYEKIGWWDFIGAEERSEAYQKFLAIGITRSLVAAKARTASTKTIGDIFVQLLFGILTSGVASDRLLNGPTNVVWIQPWLEYLRSKGVDYHFESTIKGIACDGERITSITVDIAGEEREVTGDWFIGALPVERMAPLVTSRMVTVDPRLANLKPLSSNVQWMNGIQYYMLRDVPLTHGHIIFMDSPWALTAVSQKQFWQDINFENWGDGRTKGLLSVDISEWNKPGLNGRTAMQCTRQQIADEVWVQMKRSLNVDGQTPLRDEDVHYWFLDPDIIDAAGNAEYIEDVEPLLVNRVNTWRLRPDAATGIANFMLASDYVRTNTDLATMEGANEAARRAVNAILDRSKSDTARCEIWDLHEPEALAPFREYDKARYDAGQPWDDRFPKAVEYALQMGQESTGMRRGGEGPLAALAPFTDSLSRRNDLLSDPVVTHALSMMGPPPGSMQELGGSLPGLDAPLPGIEAAMEAAKAAGTMSASAPNVMGSDVMKRPGTGVVPGPALGRIRVTQKT